ncbi:hypothetical protein [Actinomycetospora sp. NBRC 106378]|uniref:lipopolysaccharide biosynthesis protein n=1 Tax=Actinomycetospora sp. NBRC 106378 TaxID=3032208 RepID=UPI0024A0F336|nr:hypothetical protein [Actinomycetospora sp. NBRC 106378]GLZ51672.1 hypothetical protein Acsp07_12890 [Actinomycetospora sp. NBRC 106378]
MTVHPLVRRIGGFAAVPFVGAITPLLLLPVIARVTSVEGWAAVAVGQSVGAVAMIVVTFGWNLSGPSRTAQADDAGRQALYREALASRLAAFLVVLPVEGVVAWLLAPEGFRVVAVLMALAVSATGLSPAWYAIGAGQARTLLVYDALPRVGAAVVGAPLLVLGAPLETYPIALLAASLGTTAVHARHTLGRFGLRAALRQVDLRILVPDAASEIASGSYSAGAVALVGLGTGVRELAVFAAGDRLFRLSLYAISSLCNALQGWVAEPADRATVRRRFHTSLTLHSSVGVLGAFAIGGAGPWVSGVVFGSDLAVDLPTAAGFAVAFLVISLETSVGRHYLIPRGYRRTYLAAVTSAVVVGVPALVGFAHLFGAPGGAWAVAAAEGTICVVVVGAAGVVARRTAIPEPAR